jgi:hypothetical protein
MNEVLVYIGMMDGVKRQVGSLAGRCPSDHTVLEKTPPDPYLSVLRELEAADWGQNQIDPTSECAATGPWTPELIHMAQRYVAIGLTFHPSAVVTFGVLGAAIRYIASDGCAAYLRTRAEDLGPDAFPLATASRLLREFIQAAALDLRKLDQWRALVIARQFMRYYAGWA